MVLNCSGQFGFLSCECSHHQLYSCIHSNYRNICCILPILIWYSIFSVTLLHGDKNESPRTLCEFLPNIVRVQGKGTERKRPRLYMDLLSKMKLNQVQQHPHCAGHPPEASNDPLFTTLPFHFFL